MQGKYQAYPEYKNSGADWMGPIPGHWIETYLKRYCNVTDGSHHSPKTQSNGQPFVSVTDVGINNIDFENSKKITHEDFLLLAKDGCKPSIGDVLLTKDGTIGRAAIVKECFPDFVILSSLGLLTPTQSLFNHFLYYYLISGINIDQMNSMIHGSALKRMTIGKIDNLLITVPPIEEQKIIACFLNHETAKIDTLIEKQQQLIKLLKEKRQAVISHAVTKGLNPDAAMKDSGVEWLGEVPEHWIVTKAKFLYDFVTSGSRGWADYYSDNGPLFFRIANLTRDTIEPKLESIQCVTPPLGSEGVRAKIKKNDLLISITADLGSVCVANEEVEGGYVSQHVALCRPNRKVISPRWLGYCILSDLSKEQLLGSGYGGTKIQLSLEDIRELCIVLPSQAEQTEIEEFIDLKLIKFSQLMKKANDQVLLLQERRTALISAAVTGKIDVRSWQPPKSSAQEAINA